jgi:gas vesicle protein
MKSGKLLLGLLAGAGAGAMVAVLFSSKKGSEIRNKIAKQGKEFAVVVMDKLDETISHIAEKYNHINEVKDKKEPGN